MPILNITIGDGKMQVGFHSYEQWEYIGRCKECLAPIYEMDGKVRQTSTIPDHICELEEDNDGNTDRTD